jgi:hypothetical protein
MKHRQRYENYPNYGEELAAVNQSISNASNMLILQLSRNEPVSKSVSLNNALQKQQRNP